MISILMSFNFSSNLSKSSLDKLNSGIVNDIGYSNVNFFYKKFKECYGVTPAEYRKNLD